MNLMFYNFNDFNNLPHDNGRRPTANTNGKRPMTSGAGNQGMRTQNNFYKSKTLLETDKQQEQITPQNGPATNIHEQAANGYNGDRVPTRERQYRSAHQNVRRKDK